MVDVLYYTSMCLDVCVLDLSVRQQPIHKRSKCNVVVIWGIVGVCGRAVFGIRLNIVRGTRWPSDG